MIYIFAIIGVELFAKRGLNETMYMTTHSNFQTVGNADLVLFKWSTGENIDGMFVEIAGKNLLPGRSPFFPRSAFAGSGSCSPWWKPTYRVLKSNYMSPL